MSLSFPGYQPEREGILYYNIEKIGARVAKLRKNIGMKQEQLANELRIGTEVIGKLERGYRGTGIENYIILAEFFDISLDYLLTGKEQRVSELDDMLKEVTEDKKKLARKILLGILKNI